MLTELDLRRKAPSIFSNEAHSKTSSKYELIPTIDCINGLAKAGFYPVKVEESRCRDQSNRAYAKHMIRFRQQGCVEVWGNFAEIVLINSHNGLSSYQLKAGIYRLACANGLVVGNDMFHRNIRHQGNDVIERVVQGASEIINIMPRALEISEQWKGITLDIEQKNAFAKSASYLKWEDDAPIRPESLLFAHRQSDLKNDLWTTFNNVQENLIRGGLKYYNKKTNTRGRTRGVNSVTENSRLNTALWKLSETMAEILRK